MSNLPANLAALLRAAGLTVVEVSGYQTRHRPGSFAPTGFLNHHTGASSYGWTKAKELAYAKWMFTQGRSDLPAPLVQMAIGRSGTIYLGALGRANHAGKAKASGSVAAGDGNALYAGAEWMISGSETIPAAMMKAAITLNAVMTKQVFNTSVNTISAHYQTSVTGKWDVGDPKGVPFNGHKVLDMNKFRLAVSAERARLYDTVPSKPTTAAHHTRWATEPTHIYGGVNWAKGTGLKRGRLLKKGESFAVVDGSGRVDAKSQPWIQTTAGNWLRGDKTTKTKPVAPLLPIKPPASKPPSAKEVQIHFVHGSLQATDTPAQIKASIEPLLKRGAHFVSFTEVTGAPVQILKDLCKTHGYHVYIGKYQEAVAVKFSSAKSIQEGQGPVLVKGIAKRWPNRAFVWQTVEHAVLKRMTLMAAHALPKDYNAQEHGLNTGYWTRIAGWLVNKTKYGLVWMAADTNVDDATDHKSLKSSTNPLKAKNIISCWDELGAWPDTHDNRTIDVIYRVKNPRVRLITARRLAKSSSDHIAIEAIYAVKP